MRWGVPCPRSGWGWGSTLFWSWSRGTGWGYPVLFLAGGGAGQRVSCSGANRGTTPTPPHCGRIKQSENITFPCTSHVGGNESCVLSILDILTTSLFSLTGGLGLDMNMVQEASSSEDSEQVQQKHEQHEQIK